MVKHIKIYFWKLDCFIPNCKKEILNVVSGIESYFTQGHSSQEKEVEVFLKKKEMNKNED